jgi:3-dehydroquinate dehydratase-1
MPADDATNATNAMGATNATNATGATSATSAMGATSAGPSLVGVVTAPAAVEVFARTSARVVDLLEVRADLFGAEALADVAAWAAACARVEASGTPVLLTLRLAAEGGRWARPEAERLALYRAVLARDACSWIDVEAASPIAREVTQAAREHGRRSIVSRHDFARTPPPAELERLLAECVDAGADVPKLATKIVTDADRGALLALAAAHAGHACVIGMDDAPGSSLRVDLPARGSRLAYGWVDAPTAPGQLSAVEMDARLRAASPAYAARRARGQR